MAHFENLELTSTRGLLEALNILYASEIVAAQQYWNHAVAATGIHSTVLAEIFNTHADEEMGHAEELRKHIDNLGGVLNASLMMMTKANAVLTGGDGDIGVGATIGANLQFDVDGEAVAIAAYTELALAIKDTFPATADLLCDIIRDEQEHHQELSKLLQG